MTYIITEPCIDVKDTACVDVCPVDCIHPRKDESEFDSAPQLYINPDECIDCGACEPACPVEAISRNENGIVHVDNDLCIGCRECIDACPFGAMQYEEELEVAIKCDLCLERLASGKKTACLDVCPTGCITMRGDKSVAAVFER